MEDLQDLQELSVPANVRILVQKLAFKPRKMENKDILDIVDFIEHQGRIISHPVLLRYTRYTACYGNQKTQKTSNKVTV